MRKVKHVRTMKAWADVGSHGGIFMFDCGAIADRYPNLLQVYAKQVTPDLVPVTIAPVPTGNKRLDWIDKPVTLTMDGGDAAILLNLVTGEWKKVAAEGSSRDSFFRTLDALRNALIEVQVP